MMKMNLIMFIICIFLISVPVYALTEIPDEELDVVVEEELKSIPFETPVPEVTINVTEVPEREEMNIDTYVFVPVIEEPKTPESVTAESGVMEYEPKKSEAAEPKNRASVTAVAEILPIEEKKLLTVEGKSEETTGDKEQVFINKNMIQEKLNEVDRELRLLSMGNDMSEFTGSELYDNSNYDIMAEDNKFVWRLTVIFTILIFIIISVLILILHRRRNYVENSII